MIDEIRRAVQEGADGGYKIAMFHFQVLKNADRLEGTDAHAFCRDVGVPQSYAVEFSKMIALSRLMRRRGCELVKGRTGDAGV